MSGPTEGTGTETGSTAAATAASADEPGNLLADVTFHHPRWDRALYVVLPAVAVLQWLLVIPLSLRNRVLTADSPGFDPLRADLAAGVEPTGFFNDYFFVVWNLFPIVLWLLYMIADRLAVRWLSDIAPRVDTTAAAPTIERLRRIRDHPIPAVLIVLSGLAGMAAQVPKQLGFFETGAQLYWWDWRVSPAIFTIRDVALFFNTVLIVLVFWGSFFGLLIVLQAIRKGEIRPDYFHPDEAGGLLPLGNALSVLILPWVAGAFLGVIGWFDHTTGSELLFRVADVSLILVCTGVAVALFAYPLVTVRSALADEIDHVRENVYELVDQDEVSREIAAQEATTLSETDPPDHDLTDSAAVILLYQRLDNIDGWPIDNQRVVQVVLLVASPAVTVLTNVINEFIRTYWL